jgi:hypothetical protein
MTDSATPLNELLSRSLLAVTRAYEQIEPDAPSLPLLMLGPPALDGDPKTAHLRARTSKRAMVTILKRLRRIPFDEETRARAFAALAKAERKFAALRAPLVALVDRFELELPHYWVTYGTADSSVTGGRWKPGDPGPPRIPPSGLEWFPVLRAGKGAADLPTTALLSQALCNFAIDYEAMGGALGWTIQGVLPIDPDKGTPMAEVHPFAHLSGDGRSGLERHGVVKVGPKPRQIATLTPVGQRARASYAPQVMAVEDRWREAYGDSRVTKLRAALENHAPPGPRHPHLNWIPDLVEDSGAM